MPILFVEPLVLCHSWLHTLDTTCNDVHRIICSDCIKGFLFQAILAKTHSIEIIDMFLFMQKVSFCQAVILAVLETAQAASLVAYHRPSS
jgi:hypothetical protein